MQTTYNKAYNDGYSDGMKAAKEELNLLRTQVRDLRQQRDAALKTDQEPVAWRCWNMPDDRWEITTEHKRLPAGEPLYLHPAPVVSSEPVAWKFERYNYETWEKEIWHRDPTEVFTSIEDAARIRNVTPLYTAPPSRHLSDEEIMNIWDETEIEVGKLFLITFVRAVLEKVK